jgi:hypothetical protein
MEIRRGLLTQSNTKLGETIFHFDLPAVVTCPGRSSLCESKCYARKSRFNFPQVKERLAWNYEQSKRKDFSDRMVRELYRKGILVCRWHVSGDVFSPGYARKMIEIMRESPHARFFGYTRSWSVTTIEPLLREMAGLENMSLFYSADEETGMPLHVPKKVRVAWLKVDESVEPENVDLLFLDRSVRKLSLPVVAKVCSEETAEGKLRGTTCATCGFCWR